jgi:two-component system sensor histidine kinase BaeS
MSLKLKLALLTSGLVAAIVAGFAAAAYWAEERALLRAQRDGNLQSSQALAEVCREAVISGQVLGLNNYLKRLKVSPEIVEAWCVDATGILLGHSEVDRVHSPLSVDEKMRLAHGLGLSADNDFLDSVAAVHVAGRRTATALVRFSRAELKHRFADMLADARHRLTRLAGLSLIAGFAGAFLLSALALHPLNLLVHGAQTVAKGRLGHRIPVRSQDEVGWLSSEFNRMTEKLQELDRLKNDFVNGVTHDLKSPLAAVRTGLDVIQIALERTIDGKSDMPSIVEAVFTSRRALEKLTHMITSLLEAAHITEGLTLDRTPTALDDVADRVVTSFAMIARQKSLALDLIIDSAVPILPLDAAKIERAMANLVSNAIKYTEKGGVTLRVRSDADGVSLRVEDTGPGISAADQERLFTKFFRAGTTGVNTEGVGLGLVITKGFVEAHGGTMDVESVVGKGTTFVMKFPRGRD